MLPTDQSPMLDKPLSPGVRFVVLLALSLAYATFSVRPKPPGITRLLMSLPLVLLFTVAPMHFGESVIISGSLGFMFGWLVNFKLLAYSAGRGPLAYPDLGPGQWLLLLLLPYFPAKRGHTRARPGRVALSLVSKLALVAANTVFLLSPWGSRYRVLRHTGYALYVWLWVSLLLDAPLPLGCQLLGRMELQPAMNNPFVSTSVRQFWGARYNQIVSAILKDTVYDPIMDGSWMATTRGSVDRQSRAAARSAELAAATDGCGSVTASAEASNGSCSDGSSAGNTATRMPAAAADSDGPRRRTTTTTAAAAATSAASQAPDAAPLGGPFATATTAVAVAAGCGGGGGGGAAGGGAVRLRRVRVSERRRLGATVAAFAVSGIMHEACIMYMCNFRLEGSYRMMGFFLLQPLIIVVQDGAVAATARLVPERLRTSRAAAVLQALLTLALVLAAADELFWGPMEACRLDERGLAEVFGVMRAAGEWYGRLTVWFRGVLRVAAGGP